MRVFALGGYGKTGFLAINLLAQNDMVTEIAIAGRNPERARKAAAEIGGKASTVHADGTDEKKMASLTAGFDLIINAADNKAVLPCIQAAINNGAHYCDMAWAQILQDAMLLSPAAEAAGITAIIATGISPCITNLMGIHAARCVPLDLAHHPGLHLQQERHMSRLHFHLYEGIAVFVLLFPDQCFEPAVHWRNQHLAPVFRAEVHVVPVGFRSYWDSFESY